MTQAGETPDGLPLELLRRDPPRYDAAETRLLVARAATSALAAKLLTAHFFNAGDLDAAVDYALKAFTLDPEPEAAKNVVVAMRYVRRYADARAFIEANGDVFDPIDRSAALCWINWTLGDQDASRRAGLEALRLKDAEAGAGEAPPHMDAPESGARVIAFSLFGGADRYIEGARRNCIVIRHLYAGWRPRFYVDATVPDRAIEALRAENAEIVRIEDPDLAGFGTMWRFLVEDDPTVARYIVRDCDSVVNVKERAAVADWIASGAPFHVMRDHPTHCELILAGMWGAVRGGLGPMRDRIIAYAAGEEPLLNDVEMDQRFLRRVVWPMVRDVALTHDDWFSFGNCRPYPKGFDLPPDMHIGQNDHAIRT